jgi:hypothetical protein
MRRHFVRLAVVAVLLCGASVALARLNGAPRGMTGARAIGIVPAESNCQFCHDPGIPLNDPSGQLEILDVPAQFDVDTDYTLRVRLTHAWNPVPASPPNWGFQFTAARWDSGTGYGSFTPGAGNQIATGIVPGQGHASRTYVTHTGAGAHNGSLGPVEWSFTWRSPSYPTAKVYFFAAGNSADGETTSSGDYIFTAVDSSIFVNVAVEDRAIPRAELAAPAPNPAPGHTDLAFTLARPGTMDLAIFDPQGRRVRTLIRGTLPAGPGRVRWDGRSDAGVPVGAGVYFAKLVTPGALETPLRKIALTR